MLLSHLPRFCVVLSTVAVLSAGSTSMAAEPNNQDRAVHCLSTHRIDSSDVLSNRLILFRMKDRSMYVNELSRACPGLSSRDPFMYRTSIGQLCHHDSVTVLNNIGFGLSPAASCGLGMFKPIDKAGVDTLKQQLKEAKSRRPVGNKQPMIKS